MCQSNKGLIFSFKAVSMGVKCELILVKIPRALSYFFKNDLFSDKWANSNQLTEAI